jgi:hypothetical protein
MAMIWPVAGFWTLAAGGLLLVTGIWQLVSRNSISVFG